MSNYREWNIHGMKGKEAFVCDGPKLNDEVVKVIEYKAYKELLDYILLVDPYPDLSSFKYNDAFKLLREKVKEIENVDELRYGKQPEVEHKKFDDDF